MQREQQQDREREARALAALAAHKGIGWFRYPELYPVDGGLMRDGSV